MNIAIIGTGISGLTAAYLLNQQHQVTVFEAGNRLGGHTATMDIDLQGQHYAIDTGFIVYNDWTYPNFIKLMTELGVANQPTTMGFSVSCEQSGLEYSGENFNTLFAQRKNLFSPKYWRMLRDIVRFNREAIEDLQQQRINENMQLGDYLQKNRYGDYFINKYLIPMGSAIWSTSTEDMLSFPLLFFVRFFKNHGLLSVSDRPQWRVIKGGSRSYIDPLTASFKSRVRLNCPVTSIFRHDKGVSITSAQGVEEFDQVVIASHSDQALALLSDCSDAEREVLTAIPYQENDVVLHTDTRLLPNNRRTWSSWNYLLRKEQQDRAILSYNMNILQGLESEHTFVVTLNASDDIDPDKILGRYQYAHPVFSLQSEAAVKRWGDINGVNNTWFCGAYWANGFHEDGASSAIRVAKALGVDW